jgi:hypothetical protein
LTDPPNSNSPPSTNPNQRLFPLKDFCARNVGAKESAIRWQIFNASRHRKLGTGSDDDRKFLQVFVKRKNRIFIDEPNYYAWVRGELD